MPPSGLPQRASATGKTGEFSRSVRRPVGLTRTFLAHGHRVVWREHRELRRVPVGAHDRRVADGCRPFRSCSPVRLRQLDRYARTDRFRVSAAEAGATSLRGDHGLWHCRLSGRGGIILRPRDLGYPAFVVLLIPAALFFDGGFSNIAPYSAEIFPVRLSARGVGLAQAEMASARSQARSVWR